MYEKPLFVGPPMGLSSLADATAHQNMMKVGLNTGNILFARAAQTVLSPADGSPPVHVRTLDAGKSEGHDCIVVTAANWLQPRTDYGELARAIEDTRLPAFIVGLGAQSGSTSVFPELSEGTRRCVSVIAERSKVISVRGEFTADTLAHYGITNVEATGCPSLLMMDQIPPRLEKLDRAPKRITICGSRGLPHDATLTSGNPTHRLSRFFARQLLQEDVEFVAQAEVPEIYVLLEGLCKEEPIRDEWIAFTERYYGRPFGELVPVLREKMKIFFNVPDWIAYLQQRDFVVGTRLHGVITGLLAGVPSVLVVHDSRTREMAKIMMIPFIDARDIGDEMDYAAIYAAADFEGFNTGYAAYYAKFRAFFERNDLHHRL